MARTVKRGLVMLGVGLVLLAGCGGGSGAPDTLAFAESVEVLRPGLWEELEAQFSSQDIAGMIEGACVLAAGTEDREEFRSAVYELAGPSESDRGDAAAIVIASIDAACPEHMAKLGLTPRG